MELPGPLAAYDHPSWLTALGTAVSYGLILLVMFLLLFVVPLAVFVLL